jgi:hypothetical protein
VTLNIDLYVAVAAFDEYAGGGAVLCADVLTGMDLDTTTFRRTMGFAYGVMPIDDAVLGAVAMALAGVLPSGYGAKTTLHCRHEILRRALVLRDLPTSPALEKLEEWAAKFEALWLSTEGDNEKFDEALALAQEAATKQRNYDSVGG